MKKINEIKEYVITGNVVTLLICCAALIVFLPLSIFIQYSLFFLSGVALIFFLLIVVLSYIEKRARCVAGIAEPPKLFDIAFFAIVITIITYIMFFTETGKSQGGILFLLPVASAAISHGKRFSLWIALVSSLVIIGANRESFLISEPNQVANMNLIYICLMFYVAWLVGGLASLEREARSRLIELANHDELTGLANHRYFHQQLGDVLQKTKEDQGKLSLIIADIDYFKRYNDTYGHQRGDEVLNQLGQLFLTLLPSPMISTRYGGEEFAFILPGVGGKEALAIGETIRRTVEEATFYGQHEQPGGRLTLSIGVASFPANADNKEELIRAADQALYKAKFMSKNKVELYFSVLDELKEKIDRTEQELFNSVRTLISIIHAKDRYTFGHSERVVDYAVQLGEWLDLSKDQLATLKYGAFLHDVGKIEIEREVLNKQTHLTPEEWELFKQHPEWGAEIIKPISTLQMVIPLILYHHENYDGTGYPMGLQGKDIPLGARIIRVVDSFDAMVTDRPYRRGMSKTAALKELQDHVNTYYDSLIVAGFVHLIKADMDECQPEGAKEIVV